MDKLLEFSKDKKFLDKRLKILKRLKKTKFEFYKMLTKWI